MFGTNPIVGRSFFKDLQPDQLMVTSIFYTLQGEGPYSGQPCVFIRLTKCNLACSFCDTLFEQGQVMTFTEIFGKVYGIVCSYWNDKGAEVPLWAMPKGSMTSQWTPKEGYGFGLVITGGEPTLQANLSDFLQDAVNVFAWTQIESNGIVTLPLPKATTVVVSPKCTERNGEPIQYLKPSQAMLDRADALKFVMKAPRDPNAAGITFLTPPSPYEVVPQWAHEWQIKQRYEGSGKQVFVSPMNVYKSIPKKMKLAMGKADKSMEERSTVDEVVSFWENGVLDMAANQRNHEHAARYAIEHGFRFQVQTHLLASLA